MILTRRILALIGLILMARLGWSLVTGSVSLSDAGFRAVVILVVVLALARLLPRALTLFADTLDGRWEGKEVDEPASGVDESEVSS